MLNSIFQSKFKTWLLVIFLTATPIFIQLGGRGLNEPDEGRYGEMGREMLTTGDWLVPRLNGVPHYAKPPWIYWCVAASMKVFGINEWAVRLPSALAALATALMVFAMGRLMTGTAAGLLAAMILTSSGLFFITARLITPDMMLTACITAALFCFWSFWNQQHRNPRWLLGMYLAMAIGFLDKGPLTLLVVFLTILGFFWLQKQWEVLPKLGLIWGLPLVLIIALPWFLVLCKLNPDLYNFYLVGEIKDRLTSGHGRWQEWYFHLCWLPLHCWPWTILFLCALVTHIRWSWKKTLHAPSSSFLVSWFLLPLIFYSILSSKLPTYVLPIMPPMALMTGIWLAQFLESKNTLSRWTSLATNAFLLILPLGLTCYVKLQEIPNLPQQKKIIMIGGYILAVAFIASIIEKITEFFGKERNFKFNLGIWWLGSLVTFHVIILCAGRFDDKLGNNASWRTLTQELKNVDLVGAPIPSDLHPNGKLPEYKRSGPRVVTYEFYFRSCSFYLMQNKAEVVPNYAGNSLWEIEKDITLEKKPLRDDLVKLLKDKETVYVFTRPQYRIELQELTGMELPLIKAAGPERKQIILFANRLPVSKP